MSVSAIEPKFQFHSFHRNAQETQLLRREFKRTRETNERVFIDEWEGKNKELIFCLMLNLIRLAGNAPVAAVTAVAAAAAVAASAAAAAVSQKLSSNYF